MLCSHYIGRLQWCVLLNLIFASNIFLGQSEASSRTICRRFRQSLIRRPVFADLTETFSDTCPLTTSPFSVYEVTRDEKLTPGSKPSLLVCWTSDVKRFSIQFDTSVSVSDVTPLPGKLLHTCARNNDTLYVGKKQMGRKGMSKLLVSLPANVSTQGFRVFEDVTDHQGHHQRRHTTYIRERDDLTDSHLIKRRAVSEEYSVTEPSQCGVNRSCYRFGSTDCGHFQCSYYMSYQVKDGVADIELSAKAKGWVAVGFSSDKNMGGDEVIACHRTRPMIDDIIAGTFSNQYRNEPPIIKEGKEVVVLVKSIVKDGYIYCRLTRPISVDNHQDLTNDWYQLYASGAVTHSGGLEKHPHIPSISEDTITLLRIKSVQTSGSPFLHASSSCLPYCLFLCICLFCIL